MIYIWLRRIKKKEKKRSEFKEAKRGDKKK